MQTSAPQIFAPQTSASQVSETQTSEHYWKLRWVLSRFSLRFGLLKEFQFGIKPDICPLKWKILSELTTQTMSVVIQREDSKPWTVKAVFEFSVENRNGVCFEENSIETTFTHPFMCYRFPPFDRPTFPKKNLAHEDTVVVVAKIIVKNCCVNDFLDVVLSDNIHEENSEQLQFNFKSLLKNPCFSDVTLKLGEDTFYAHKCVLSARSPTFQNLFKDRKKEENIVVVKGVQRHVLEEFLLFLYTGSLTDRSRQTIMSLFVIACDYGVESLKKTCSFVLISYINPHTVFQTLNVAYTRDDIALTDAALEYIVENFQVLKSSLEWKELTTHYSSLASIVSEKVSSRMIDALGMIKIS